MRNKVLIAMCCFAISSMAQPAPTPQRTSNATTPENTSTTSYTAPLEEMMTEVGVSGNDIPSYISGFIRTFSSELSNAFQGRPSKFTTPESLISLTALVTSTIFKNPLLRVAMIGTGSYGIYDSMMSEPSYTPNISRPDPDVAPAPEIQSHSTNGMEPTPTEPTPKTPFYTIKRQPAPPKKIK